MLTQLGLAGPGKYCCDAASLWAPSHQHVSGLPGPACINTLNTEPGPDPLMPYPLTRNDPWPGAEQNWWINFSTQRNKNLSTNVGDPVVPIDGFAWTTGREQAVSGQAVGIQGSTRPVVGSTRPVVGTQPPSCRSKQSNADQLKDWTLCFITPLRVRPV